MPTFELSPRKWYSSDYRVLRDGTELTRFTFLSGPERSHFALACNTFVARKEKWNSPNFFLDQGATRLALAVTPHWSLRIFHLEYEGKPYGLRATSGGFVLTCNGVERGLIAKKGWLSRQATADLPDDLPLPVNLFLIWLSLLMWKRDSDGAGSTAMFAS
jgi:hypothetical protein